MIFAQDLLFLLCRSSLNGGIAPTSINPQKVNWSDVCNLAMQQGVAGVAFDAVQDLYAKKLIGKELPTELKLNWYACQQQIEQQNKKVNLVLQKVVRLLNKNNFPVVLLKGQGLAQLYPNPAHRVSGDIDLFVGVENDKKIRKLFAEQGWLDKNLGDENIKHWTFSLDGVLIEMHYYCTVIPGIKRNLYFQKWMDSALRNSRCGFLVSDGVFVRTLPLIENLVFTFIHMFQHFISGGMSLKQLLDVGVLIRKGMDELGCDRLNNELYLHLKKTGYLRCWQVFGCILVKYLGFKPEEFPCYNYKHESKADEMLQYVFDSARKRASFNKDNKRGIWNKTKHYVGVCTKHFSMLSLFPAECFGSFFYMLADVSTKHYHRSLQNN